jgi:hypothetical protein
MIQEDERLPLCPLYHPLSDLKNKSGCYPNISDDQLIAAKKVLYVCKRRQIILHIHLYIYMLIHIYMYIHTFICIYIHI